MRPASQAAEAGARTARVRARSSRHQMSSYAWSATQTAATSASATSAGTTSATGQQQRARNRGDQAAAAERARNAQAERYKREQVQRGAAAEPERRDRGELVADVCERRLHREREQDDAGHHRQVQVGVDVARKGDALDAGSVGEQLLRADREEVEVRQPERGRHHEPEHGGDDHAGAEPALLAPRPIAINDSPIAMITISP